MRSDYRAGKPAYLAYSAGSWHFLALPTTVRSRERESPTASQGKSEKSTCSEELECISSSFCFSFSSPFPHSMRIGKPQQQQQHDFLQSNTATPKRRRQKYQLPKVFIHCPSTRNRTNHSSERFVLERSENKADCLCRYPTLCSTPRSFMPLWSRCSILVAMEVVVVVVAAVVIVVAMVTGALMYVDAPI
jgi:hypothetical protein